MRRDSSPHISGVAVPPRPALPAFGQGSAGASPWGPFRRPVFRVLWAATLVANVGTWMHDVAAGWLMTSLAPSPLMVALVQTATTLPVLILALPAGALADVLDRRRVLLFAQVWMTVAALLLGFLTLAGATDASVLLLLTFIVGIGTAVTAPAWQAIVPELVEHRELPAAVALNSAGINIARAVGPALGGLVVTAMGPAAAFLLNGVSFLGVVGGLVWWKRPVEERIVPRERIPTAVGVGIRYVRSNPRLLAVLVRTFAFVTFGSALWALLPLLARQRLGTGALGYGVLLGAMGLGALVAAALLPNIRRRASADRMVVVATAVYAGVLVASATIRSVDVLLPVMAAGGAAWLVLLATFQTGAQLAVPSWVRGRALAVYLMVFFGGQAGGALVWGVVAEIAGIPAALAIAAVGLGTGLTAGLRYRLGSFEPLDLTPSRHLPEHVPELVPAPERDGRPVTVQIEYGIDPLHATPFLSSMEELRRVRLRSGAFRWVLLRDLESRGRYVERFDVPSWHEHLRQHERLTVADREAQEIVWSFQVGEARPEVRHFIADPTSTA